MLSPVMKGNSGRRCFPFQHCMRMSTYEMWTYTSLGRTQTLSSIVAPTLSVFTATGTETSDSFSPRPSPPNTAPNAPSPSFLFKTSFSLGISQSSKTNIDPVKLESRRPSSRRRFLVLRYFEEYLARKKIKMKTSGNMRLVKLEMQSLFNKNRVI